MSGIQSKHVFLLEGNSDPKAYMLNTSFSISVNLLGSLALLGGPPSSPQSLVGIGSLFFPMWFVLGVQMPGVPD